TELDIATATPSESVAKTRAAWAIVDLGRLNMMCPLVDERAKDEKSAPETSSTCDPHINRAFVRHMRQCLAPSVIGNTG
ncbi:hypothetical protein, partial [Mesorhizobium sp. M7A.F.Ca.US.014.04.1.1]